MAWVPLAMTAIIVGFPGHPTACTHAHVDPQMVVMSDKPLATRLLLRSFVILTALMCGLAFGAVWAVLGRMTGHDLPWIGVLAAGGMVWSMHSTTQHDAAWSKALLAASGTLLAAFYSECLGALMRLSGELGLPLLEVLRAAGVSASVELGRISIHNGDVAWYLLAAVVAVVLSLASAAGPADDAP